MSPYRVPPPEPWPPIDRHAAERDRLLLAILDTIERSALPVDDKARIMVEAKNAFRNA